MVWNGVDMNISYKFTYVTSIEREINTCRLIYLLAPPSPPVSRVILYIDLSAAEGTSILSPDTEENAILLVYRGTERTKSERMMLAR